MKQRLVGVEIEDTISLEFDGAATHWAGDTVAVVTRPDTGDVAPLSPSREKLRTAGIVATRRFLRVGRTPASRKLVNEVLGIGEVRKSVKSKGPLSWWGKSYDEVEGKEGEEWSQGRDGVYITGGWCWDGMVLLEGCVVSGGRVVGEVVARRGLGKVLEVPPVVVPGKMGVVAVKA